MTDSLRLHPGPCAGCGAELPADVHPGTRWCRSCFYAGEPFKADPRLAPFWDGLGPRFEAHVEHTGGGCFGIVVHAKDRPEPIAFLTEAWRDGAGEWEYDASIPTSADGPWALGVYASLDAFYEADDGSPISIAFIDSLNVLWAHLIAALIPEEILPS